MKKLAVLLLGLVILAALYGCGTRSMNSILANEPSVTGIVEEVHDTYVILYAENAQGYPHGSRWSVPLDAAHPDSHTDLSVGDEIVVYFDGSAMETDPLQMGTVYAITLKEPADRSKNETP